MKATTRIYIGIGVVLAAMFFIARRPQSSVVREFSWTLDVDLVRYSLLIENRTEQRIEGLLVLVAETKSEGDDGITIIPRGAKQFDVSVDPGEKKEMKGEFRLNGRGDSHLVVYPVIKEKRPKQRSTAQRVSRVAGR